MIKYKRLRRVSALFAALSALLLTGCARPRRPTARSRRSPSAATTYPPMFTWITRRHHRSGRRDRGGGVPPLGYRAEFTTIDWGEKDRAGRQRRDRLHLGLLFHAGRENNYQWAGPYLASRQVVAVDAQSGIETISELEGKTIAVQATGKPEAIFLRGGDNVPPSGTSSVSRTAACSMPCSTAAMWTRSRRTRRPSGST